MTAQAFNEIATAILARVPRIAASELLSEKDAHDLVVSRLQRLFRALERLSDEAAIECEGKTEDQIRAILLRKLDAMTWLQPIPRKVYE